MWMYTIISVKKKAINNISFDIGRNEVIAMIGLQDVESPPFCGA